MESKKIVILIRTLQPGGAEKQSVLLAKALNKDFNVTLIVQRGEFIEEKYIKTLVKNDIRFVLIKGNVLKRSIMLFRFFREEKAHIVFSYLTSDNFWSAIIGKIAGVKHLIGGVRSNFLPKQKFLITKFLHFWFQDYTIFNNYAGYSEFIQQGFKKEKSVIINNCIDEVPDFYRREQSHKIKILSVARFIEGKDHLTAIKAFQYLLSEYSYQNQKQSIEYVIIGHGELEGQIKQWISDFGLKDRVIVKINPKNLMDYYKESDIYLCASVYEGFSNSIMEAMFFSMPVVATDVGDNKSMVENTTTGFIVPPKDYVKIAEKLNNLIQSYDDRISFGKAGNSLIKTQFSLETFKSHYIKLIDKLE